MKTGFTKLASKPAGVTQDFVRGGVVKVDKFKVVPGDIPDADNDLKDTVEDAVIAGTEQECSVVYAFCARFGLANTKDKYFKLTGCTTST